MLVDQAIYGAVRNGHGLRCASGDQKFAAELAGRLDLPDTAPPGADWSPYLSGFAHHDHYILARTFHDPSAGRAGMVLTHALIGSLDGIVAVGDLRPLLQRLISDATKAPNTVEPLTIDAGHEAPPTSPDLTDAARSLVVRASGPVVRIGTLGVEDLVAALWFHLWPALRRRFSFRLSFGPGDIVEQLEPTFVCTPASLIGRWQQQRIVGRSGTAGSLAAAMIDGSEAGIPLRQFADRIGAVLARFEELPLIERAYLMASAKPDSVARLLAAVRLIERISPGAGNGDCEKRAIIDRLVAALPKATPSEVLSFRNLSLPGFATGSLIWEGLESWLERNNFPQPDDADLRQILYDTIVRDDAERPWRDAVARGLKTAARGSGGSFPVGFWRWAVADPALISPLITLIQGETRAIERLVDTAPTSLDPAVATPILASAAKLKLFGLHAVAVSASLAPVEAARAQSAVEPGTGLAAMRLALRNATPAEVLDCVGEVDDPRVLRIAGEMVANTPVLLAKRDMSEDANRKIWAAALETNPESWRGPADPQRDFYQILVEQIEGRHAPTELLERLSTTPLADLSSFARRSELWRHISGVVRNRLIAATTDAWFAHADDDTHDPTVESEIAGSILQDQRLNELLTRLSTDRIAAGLRVIAALAGLDHARFRNWITAAVQSTRPLTTQDANLVGQSVASRGWRDVVEDLISIYRSGRQDVEPVLRHCLDMMGFWNRLRLNLSPVTASEKWDSFMQLAAELYPSGPDHNSLWERAGGHDSDLVHQGSGNSRWRAAVREIQRGKPPRIAQLVREMQNDFEGNPKLHLLANDPLFSR